MYIYIYITRIISIASNLPYNDVRNYFGFPDYERTSLACTELPPNFSSRGKLSRAQTSGH